MFKRFYLRNFKVWGEQLWTEGVELAPVTLFLGTNSAGKTSLLQLPLLLKQTFESPDRHLDLNLGGQPADILDLGTCSDLVHDHDKRLDLGLGLEYEGDIRSKKASQVTYRVEHTLASGVPVAQELSMAEGGSAYGVARQSKGGYLLRAPGYEPRQMGNRPDARRAFQPERSLTFSAEALAELGESSARIQDLGLRLGKAVGDIAYLGPLRERPERSYMWNRQNPGDLGSRGERAVHALLASANTRKRWRGWSRAASRTAGRSPGPRSFARSSPRRSTLTGPRAPWCRTTSPTAGMGDLRGLDVHSAWSTPSAYEHSRPPGAPKRPSPSPST